MIHASDPALRFAVLGCGRMGARRLANLASEPGAVIACVADPIAKRARAAGADYRVPHYLDWRRALEGADGVVVCTPNSDHAPIVLEALRRGKHVFCEKPLATSVRDARGLVAAALAGRGTLAVGANLRRFANVARAHEAFKEGAIGELVFLRARVGHGGWNRDIPWFRDRRKVGGGALLDNGCHALDAVRWFMGEVSECVAMTAPASGSSQEDNAMAVFADRRGRLASVHASWTDWEGYFHMDVHGTKGFLRVESRGDACLLISGSKDGRRRVEDLSAVSKTSFQDEISAYLRSLRAGARHEPDGYDGLRCVQMADAAYRAAQGGRRVGLWSEADRRLSRRLRGRRGG